MRADDAAAAAVEAAVRWHLGDLCKRLGLPIGGSVEQQKARIIARASGPKTKATTLDAPREAALVAMGQPASLPLGPRADFYARICVWRALEDAGFGQSAAARMSVLGRYYERTTIIHGVSRWGELVEAGGSLAGKLKAGRAAAMKELRCDTRE